MEFWMTQLTSRSYGMVPHTPCLVNHHKTKREACLSVLKDFPGAQKKLSHFLEFPDAYLEETVRMLESTILGNPYMILIRKVTL